MEPAELEAILSESDEFRDLKHKNLMSNTNLIACEIIREKISEYGKFLTKMDDACQLLNIMLSSKSITDTVEVIRVFKLLYQYGLPQANIGIRKMLTLVFSKEAQLQTAVQECYTSIYFSDNIRA